jgi:hypothetical protein
MAIAGLGGVEGLGEGVTGAAGIGGGGSGGGGLTVGTTTITGGADGQSLVDSNGVLGSVKRRTLLTANTTYYVSTATSVPPGNDSNPGTLAAPWLTLQHAMFFIASMLDIAGFIVRVNIGPGSFAGFGVESTVGGGFIQFTGAGSALTTITAGPNDGVYNYGECYGFNVPIGSAVGLNAVTLAPSANNYGLESSVAGNSIFLGDGPSGVGGDIKFVTAPGVYMISHSNLSLLQINAGTYVIAGSATSPNCHLQIIFSATILDLGTWTLTGSADTYGVSFAQITDDSFYKSIGSVYTGSANGPRFSVTENSAVDEGGVGLNYFPGSVAGTCDASSSYGGYIFAQQISGLPLAANLYAGAYEVFKDTSGGGVYLAYNDAGTIERIQLGTNLTADTTFYISTAGSDSTGNGTSGNPWATGQHANDFVASSYNGNGYNVIFQFADGTYAGVNISRIILNAAQVVWKGNVADYTKVIFNEYSGGNACFDYNCESGQRPFWNYVTFKPLTAAHHGIIMNVFGTDQRMANCGWIAPAGGGGDCVQLSDNAADITAGFDPILNSNVGGIYITGTWNSFINIFGDSDFFLGGPNITMLSTPAFSTAFVIMSQGGIGLVHSSAVFVGTATGVRFKLSGTAAIITRTNNLNLLPGNTAGTFSGGSDYDDFSAVLTYVAPVDGIYDVTYQGGVNILGGNAVNRGVNIGNNNICDITLGSNIGIGWSSTTDPTAAQDTNLFRGGAGIIRAGTGADSGSATGTIDAAAYQVVGVPGITATITTAKVTPVTGANGSMTFVNGILTAQTQAT